MTLTPKTIRDFLRASFPNHVITVSEGTYSWTHHTQTVFERRSAPAIMIEKVENKERAYSERTGKRICNDPSFELVLDALRSAGYCAETNTSAGALVCVVDAEGDARPVNIAFGIGKWHNRTNVA